MLPPIFVICSASAAVKALLGADPLRLYPFGEAPQGVQKPYAVWQTVGGSPENYLAGVPDADSYTVQVDVYSDQPVGPGSVTGVAAAIRDALEQRAYITGWGNTSRDPETKNYRYSFTVDFINLR